LPLLKFQPSYFFSRTLKTCGDAFVFLSTGYVPKQHPLLYRSETDISDVFIPRIWRAD